MSIHQQFSINPYRPKPNPLTDRKALDDIVFDILGLTEDERNEVYWAVCELVKKQAGEGKERVRGYIHPLKPS